MLVAHGGDTPESYCAWLATTLAAALLA